MEEIHGEQLRFNKTNTDIELLTQPVSYKE